MKASLYNYRQSPRTVRLVANLIKGMKISDAEVSLSFLPKRASLPILKLLRSATANAEKNFNMKKDSLIVSDVRVDKGIVLKRMMPRARGSGARILKRTSHVVLILKEAPIKGMKKISKKKVSKSEPHPNPLPKGEGGKENPR